MLGVLLASRLGDNATIRQVVIAAEDLTPGTVIEPGDVVEIDIRLSEDVDWVVTDAASIYGSVLLGPVDRLEFVQFSNIAEGTPDAVPSGLAVVSIEVDSTRAPATLSAGELVSVIATYDDDDQRPVTKLIAEEVIVLSYNNGGDEFGGVGSETVLRVGVAEGTVASEIVRAAVIGEVFIIGVTGATEVEIPAITPEIAS